MSTYVPREQTNEDQAEKTAEVIDEIIGAEKERKEIAQLKKCQSSKDNAGSHVNLREDGHKSKEPFQADVTLKTKLNKRSHEIMDTSRRKQKDRSVAMSQDDDGAKTAILKLEKPKVIGAKRRKPKRTESEETKEESKEEEKDAVSLSPYKVSSKVFKPLAAHPSVTICTAPLSKVTTIAPPSVHLKVVQVNLQAGKPLDLVLSANLVIRTVNKYSIAFFSVIVGDQIIKINDVVPMSVAEFLSIMRAEQSTLRLSILRAWNIKPSTEPRMAWVKRQDNYSYFIAEVYNIKDLRNGFDVKIINKQCFVTRVECNSRGAHVFLLGDRLLDVDSIPITASTDLKFVRRQFNRVMTKEGKCTFLVERLNSLRSSPNPSCFAKTLNALDNDMGDDATEIGCRESMRYQLLYRKFKPTPILHLHGSKTTEFKTCEEDEGPPKTIKRSKRWSRRRASNRKIAIDTRTETMRVPSDVKEDVILQKVTPRSGLISFVRSVIYR